MRACAAGTLWIPNDCSARDSARGMHRDGAQIARLQRDVPERIGTDNCRDGRGVFGETGECRIRSRRVELSQRLSEIHAHPTATELEPSFAFEGERIPLVNPQRGIFAPRRPATVPCLGAR